MHLLHSTINIPSPVLFEILFYIIVVLLEFFPPNPIFNLILCVISFFYINENDVYISKIPSIKFLYILFSNMCGLASFIILIPDQ
jgi:hypothetical protein